MSESSSFIISASRPYGDTSYGIFIGVPIFSSEFSYSRYQNQAGDISVKYTFPADFSEYDKFSELNEQCNVSLIVEFGDFSYIR